MTYVVPEFFRRENMKEPTEQEKELRKKIHEAIQKYQEHFPDDNGLMTEAFVWPRKEWPDIIERCIAENKTMWELFGEEYDPEADY